RLSPSRDRRSFSVLLRIGSVLAAIASLTLGVGMVASNLVVQNAIHGACKSQHTGKRMQVHLVSVFRMCGCPSAGGGGYRFAALLIDRGHSCRLWAVLRTTVCEAGNYRLFSLH